MSQTYSVSLEKMIDFHKLETVYMPRSADEILITTSEVNRPGIVLTGYTDYFDSLRIQILGWTEIGFIRSMEPDEREAALDCWLSLKPAAAVVTRGLEIPDYLYDACKKHEIPLLKTEEETSPFLAALIEFLNTELAPRITRHGVLVEVYGEGVLITGESGAGKSETAIELIKRMMDACYQGKRIRDMLPPLPDGVASSYIQYLDIIEKLEKQGIQVRVSDVSDALSLPRPGVTRTVKDMEAKGYVKKFASAEDGRVTYLTVTEAGKALSEKYNKQYFTILSGYVDSIPDEDILCTIRTMEKFYKIMCERRIDLDK